MNSLIFSFIPPIPSLYFYIICTLYLVCSFLLFSTAIPVLLLMESLTWQGQETAVLPSGVESVIWNSELLLLRNPQTKREWVAFPCTLYLSLELGLKACDSLPSIGIKGVSHTKCSSFLHCPCVSLGGLELTDIQMPLSPKSWDERCLTTLPGLLWLSFTSDHQACFI